VCVALDGTAAPEIERRRIVEAVPRYHRKGTLPALERDLRALGWEGFVEETFHTALRLNLRALLNKSRLSGELNGHGVYRIHSFNYVPGLRNALRFHHPAGTRAFWYQWFLNELSLAHITGDAAMHLRYLFYTSLDETFVLNRSNLNDCNHLTRKQRAWGIFQLSSVSTVDFSVESAATCISRWHGRQNRMRLGQKRLNNWRLASGWESERKLIECHQVYGGTLEDNLRRRYNNLRLGEGVLNQDSLSLGMQERFIRFKQKDFYAPAEAESMHCLGDSFGVELFTTMVLSPLLRLNLTGLHRGARLGASADERSKITATMQSVVQSTVESSIDRVDRYRRRGVAFKLGSYQLNQRILTDAYLNSERAAFEMRTRTDHLSRGRISPVVLGQTRLNQYSLRLHWMPGMPLVLGRGSLNQQSLKQATPDFRWLIHQTDFVEPVTASSENVANYRVTRWPST